MLSREPYLTKTRFVQGLQCSKRLWLAWHDPAPRKPPAPGTPMAVGLEVGIAARNLIPHGILVDQPAYRHADAIERTRALMADPAVPAIFEAAFEAEGVRIRVDILERLPSGWRLCEVKSSTKTKPEHLDELALQWHVITASGVDLVDAQLIRVNNSYVRGKGALEYRTFFGRDDTTDLISELLPGVPAMIAAMHETLGLPEAPAIRPGKHCTHPYECEFWSRCTATKPADWIIKIPRLSPAAFRALDAAGIESMRDIPASTRLTPSQRRIVDVALAGREHISPGLASALSRLAPPVGYLDCETFNPAIPLYSDTHPYQQLPFQWSLHHDNGDGDLAHHEFLAHGNTDPRREFAETLLSAVEGIDGALVVYSAFEATVFRALAGELPDLTDRLAAVIDRLIDLLPIVRNYVAHPSFVGSYSIKAVAPALSPDIAYDDPDGVADGSEASALFYWLVTDTLIALEDRIRCRQALLAYCCRDTLAMVHVHRRLLEYATAHSPHILGHHDG